MNMHSESELISPYIDGEMGDAERTTFETHLGSCAECSTLLTAMRATLGDLAGLGDAPMPAHDSWALRARISRERTHTSRFGRIAIATGSVAALLAGITVLLLHAPTGSHNFASGVQRKAATAPILLNDTDYSATTARDVFALASGTNPYGNLDLGSGSGTTQTGGSAPANAAAPAPQGAHVTASLVSEDPDFQKCADHIQASAYESMSVALYMVARYEGAQAYFMVFDVPANSPTRRDLWIVKPGTCGVLRFEQTKLK